MRNVFARLWADDNGVVAIEYIFVATVVVIGMVAGLVALKEQVNAELSELGAAVHGLNTGYIVSSEGTGGSTPSGNLGTYMSDPPVGALQFNAQNTTPYTIASNVP
jgi:Flp pilus assembly pilin Flp